MGHRANFIILQNQGIDIYYSHWGAISIPRDIFYSPEITINYIKSLKPVETLLDDIWCEGAVLVDIDQKQLLFWGGDGYEYPALRKYLIGLVQINWEGWGVRWAEQGIVDIASYLQIDLSTVQTELDSYHWTSYTGYFKKNLEQHIETIVTVKYNEHLTLDYGFDNYLTELFSLGFDLFEHLEEWHSIALPPEDKVCSGAYFNLPSQEIWVWWGRNADYRVIDKIAEYWQNWKIKRHTEGLLFQVELSGRNEDKIRIDEKKAIKQLIDYVSRENHFHLQQMIDSVLSNYSNQGNIGVWINPDALEHKRPRITSSEKQRILKKVLDKVGR